MKRLAVALCAATLALAGCKDRHAGKACMPCAPGKECQLALDLPFDAEQAALVASGSLSIGPGTVVRSGANADGAVANLGEDETRIEAGASVGGVFSNAAVRVQKDARLNGPVKTLGALDNPSGVPVKGHVTTGARVHPDRHVLATVSFTAGASAVSVAAGANRALAPGQYGATDVAGGGTLALAAGTYYFASLAIAENATLSLDESAGPVIVFVQDGFSFAGKQTETGGEGRVLVAILDCGDDVISASFRGTILAPGATLSLGPKGGAAFGGRFFGGTVAVGPNNTVTGLGLTVPPAPIGNGGGGGGSAGAAPIRLPTRLPPPPDQTGCYEHDANGWHPVPCATNAFIQQHFPHPDAQLTVSSSATPSLVYGQLAVTIPAVASEQNGFVSAVAGIPGCQSTGSPVSNQWSVQNNTNQWSVPSSASSGAGDTAATQFTMQSDGSTTGICIWNVDVSSQAYSNKCVNPSPAQRSGGLQAYDFGNLVASVTPSGKLMLTAQLSWVPSHTANGYAVVNDDTYGLSGNWTEVSGGILGLGNCSQAQFTNAQVATEIAVSTCQGDTDATGAVCPPPTLQPNASVFIGGTGTVETSNLVAASTPSVTYPNADLAVTSLLSSTSGNCVGGGHAYVKDNDADFGATPSNLGGQVFWESPDIFLVPHGTPVDVNAVSTETLITAGGNYDIYIRVHNDLGCAAVDNVRALVYLADPSALSVQWAPITGGNYVGDNGGATGVTAPVGGAALIGPIPFTAPTTGIGNGHKCLLAAIEANGESAPANVYDAPDSNQVAQRNLQFSGPCVFPLTNGTASTGSVAITLSASPNTGAAPSLTGLPQVQVDFDDFDSSWFNVWNAQTGNGTAFKVTHAGTKTSVRLGQFSVSLNPVQLAAGQTRSATGTTILPSGYPTALTLQIGASLSETSQGSTTIVANGGSCVTEPPPVIR